MYNLINWLVFSSFKQGTVERLMSHLLEDSSGDPSYVEDFLLTHRIFIESPLIVCSQLLEWYAHANTLCVLSPPNVHSLIQVFTFFFLFFFVTR